MKLAAAEQDQDLYPDRHLNVFVPYKSHGLDYNVTRAMISTLRWSHAGVTQAFLKAIAGVETGASAYHYDLHAVDYEDLDPAKAKVQVVLGISVAGRLSTNLPPLDDAAQSGVLLNILRAPAFLNSPPDLKLEQVRKVLGRPELTLDDLAVLFHTLEELEEGIHPDGWIFSSEEGGVCVLMEAKLTSLLDLSQLQRYADVYYDRDYSADQMVLSSWEAIAAFFHDYRRDDDPRTAFLCGQLVDYLDLLGLATFKGFRPYDFDLEAAQEALPKFFKFAERIHAVATERGLPLGDVRMSPTGARIDLQSLPGELALDIREAGLRVELALGDTFGVDLPGRAAVDAVLAAHTAEDANPLAGMELPALTARVDRLQARSADGLEAFPERTIMTQALDAAEFHHVLGELRRQHPSVDAAKDATGHYRRGKLAIGYLVPKAEAIGDGAALIEGILGKATHLVHIARALAGS